MRWAASLARRTGSALRVVWAWKIRDVWDTAVAADDQHTGPHLAELEGVARRRLTEVLTGLLGRDAAHVDIHLCQGPDSAGILLHAAAGADILVVGSRGRGRAASAVLGFRERAVRARIAGPGARDPAPHGAVRRRGPRAGRGGPASRAVTVRPPRQDPDEAVRNLLSGPGAPGVLGARVGPGGTIATGHVALRTTPGRVRGCR